MWVFREENPLAYYNIEKNRNMKQICPCCHQECDFPSVTQAGGAGGVEEDIGNLFSCSHCQSVLKREGSSLKVVYDGSKPDADLESSPVEPFGFAEPVEPFGPAEPAEPVEPAKPAKPAEFFESVEPAKPAESFEPVESVKPFEPVEPAKPAESFEPVESVEPFEPVEPAKPAESFEPVESVEPFEPAFLNNENVSTEEEVFSKANENKEGAFLKEQESSDAQNVLARETSFAAKEEGVYKEPPPSSVDNSEEFAGAELIEKQEKEVNQDFSDVEEYGNAQSPSGKGFLRYDLCISGLYSVEIEQQVLSALEDPRFQWDAKEILQSQKEGVLVIKNLNPIKAMCLVSDLSFLPVELSWKQYMALNAPREQTERQGEED